MAEYVYDLTNGVRKHLSELRSKDKRRYITHMRITGGRADTTGVVVLTVNARRCLAVQHDVLREPEGVSFRAPIWDDDVCIEVTGETPVTVALTVKEN